MRKTFPVITVLLVITAIWYLGSWRMNTPWALQQAARAEQTLTTGELFKATMQQDRPRLPAPHQVVSELWKSTGAMVQRGKAFSKRSLIYHGAITLGSTLTGFALGVFIGILGAVAITYSRVMEMSLMPWAIVSQTIPIVALAPMIIVLSNAVGIESRAVPKAIISAYLCYFPVLVGMVKGLNSPGTEQLDLLKTYNAGVAASFFKLRLPASMPYLFTSLKIAIAAALVGTIVGELPTGAISGLGARILIGDQFGTPLAIWSALFAAAILAGVLVTLLGLAQGLVLKRMGMAR